MSKVSKMSLRDIIDEINVIMRENDIIFICNDINVIKEFMEIYKKSPNDREKIKKLLLDNEEHIDKEKFVLLTVKNYKDNIKLLEKYASKSKKDFLEGNPSQNITELTNYNIQLYQQQENLVKALKLGKGMETFFTYYCYDEKDRRYKVEVVDSREIIDGKNTSFIKAQRKFDEIDSSFKNEDSEDTGLEYVLQSMLLTDLYNVFPNEQFGNDIRTMILENEVLKKKIKTREQLEALKTLESYDEYSKLVDNIEFDGMLPDVKETLRKYAAYIDMDKLLLISAYRFQEAVESGIIAPKMYDNVKYILVGILSNLKTQNLQITCELQNKKDYELYSMTYGAKDIKKCLSQFAGDKYLTTEEIEDYQEKINSGELNLSNIHPNYIDIIFSRKELEQLSALSVTNLLHVYYKYEWDESEIIKLYEQDKIPLEYIEAIKGFVNLSNAVSFETLNSYYNQMQENPENEETLNRYNKYLELYKEVLIKGKNKEKIEKNSSLIIENLAETLGQEEYEKTVRNYYIEGLISLDSIVEWSNSTFITELFNEGIISLEDIKSVGVKLGYHYLNNLYTALANEENIDYDKRIEYLESGLVEEEDVINLYNKGLIMDEDLLKLAKKSIVNLEYAQQTIDNRQLEDRIKTARAKALGWSDSNLLFHIDGIEKKHRDGVMYTDISFGGIRKEKLIINPNVRQQYIEMLGLYRIETECSQDNPFYNYEFYATPDESGAIGANSVIIAERYYQNKYDEKTFATNNATYFFKYKDFLVLSNLQKQDMIKERENVVFRTNHTISINGKRGTWAENVLHNVLKTMLGSDLADLSKKENRTRIIEKMSQMYTPEECKEILKLCKEIDSGEHICNKDGIQYIKNTIGPDFNDDNDAR